MAIELYLAENDSLISEDQTTPLALTLFADQNEEKEVRLYAKVQPGFSVSGLEIVPQGLTANKWALAPDNGGVVGTYGAQGGSIALGTVEDRIYFWAKAQATDNESPTTDTSVSLYLSGTAESVSTSAYSTAYSGAYGDVYDPTFNDVFNDNFA